MYLKFLTLLGKITTVFLIIATAFSMQGRLDVYANSSIKTEALLTISYNKPVTFFELSQNLKKDIQNQDLVRVTNLTASLDLGSNTQTFSLSNEDQPSSKFLKNFYRQASAVIPSMITLKEEGKIDTLNKALLNKYTTEQLKYSKKVNSDIAIKSLTIVGSLKNLETLKTGKVSKNAEIAFLSVSELELIGKKIDAEVGKVKKPQDKLAVAQKEIQKIAKANPVDSVSLTEAQIAELDKTMIKDLSGNIAPSQATLKKLNLSNSDTIKVRKMIGDYNNVPVESKDGSLQSMESIKNSAVLQKEVQKRDTLLDKAQMILFGEVSGNAWYSSGGYWGMWYSIDTQWWGIQLKLNRTALDNIVNFAAGTVWSMLWTPLIAACAYVVVAFTVCVWIVRSILSAAVWGIRNWIVSQPWWCRNGATVNANWNGQWGVSCY